MTFTFLFVIQQKAQPSCPRVPSLEPFLTYWKQEMLVQTFIDYKSYLVFVVVGPTNISINTMYTIFPCLLYVEVDQVF